MPTKAVQPEADCHCFAAFVRSCQGAQAGTMVSDVKLGLGLASLLWELA